VLSQSLPEANGVSLKACLFSGKLIIVLLLVDPAGLNFTMTVIYLEIMAVAGRRKFPCQDSAVCLE